jgi:hypothetical protein
VLRIDVDVAIDGDEALMERPRPRQQVWRVLLMAQALICRDNESTQDAEDCGGRSAISISQ